MSATALRPQSLATLVHRLARRCRAPLEGQTPALLRRWLVQLGSVALFVLWGVGGCTAVFWFLASVLLDTAVAAGLLPAAFTASSAWWALSLGAATTTTCAAVAAFTWRDLRRVLALEPRPLRLRLAAWRSPATTPETLALETAVRLAEHLPAAALAHGVAFAPHRDARGRGWTLTLPWSASERLEVALDGWPRAPALSLRAPRADGRLVHVERTLGGRDRALDALREALDALLDRLEPSHARPRTARAAMLHPVTLRAAAPTPAAALRSLAEPRWSLALREPASQPRPPLPSRVACGGVARVSSAALVVAPLVGLGLAVMHALPRVPAGALWGALPALALCAALLALPGLELRRALCHPRLVVEPSPPRRRLVARDGRLDLVRGAHLERGIDLREPFVLTLTRTPHEHAPHEADTATLGLELRQPLGDTRTPVVLALRVPVVRSEGLEALASWDADAAPLVDGTDFARTLWPTLRLYAEIHGQPLPWDAECAP